MPLRRNRRQLGRGTPQASYPRQLVAVYSGLVGMDPGFTIFYAKEGQQASSLPAYTKPLIITGDPGEIVDQNGQPCLVIGQDQMGAGGATRLILTMQMFAPGFLIYLPSNWQGIRGQDGEWLAPTPLLP